MYHAQMTLVMEKELPVKYAEDRLNWRHQRPLLHEQKGAL